MIENNDAPDLYFDSYEDLDVHHIMLKDKPRTLAYKNAIFNMKDKFANKVVMDVGAGTGILSIFCAQAGAKQVYAIEASNLAELAKQVAEENNVQEIVKVIQKKVENISSEEIEKVDIIVSEWMGFYLLHEGMLDSVIYARDTFLKDDGLIFPCIAKIYAAPCQLSRYNEFWDNVFGVSMKCVAKNYRDAISKPKILTLPKEDVLAEGKLVVWLDLNTVTVEELNNLGLETVLTCTKSGKYEGCCIWFDVEFPDGSVLSTSPSSDSTHWEQTIIILPISVEVEEKEPIAFDLKFDRRDTDPRKYNVTFSIFDASEVPHDIPCDCNMIKCVVTRTYVENHSTVKD